MTLYTVIDNKERPFNLALGDEGADIQQDIIFSSQVHSGQQLPEGKWEYRRYANGAIALACADRDNKLVVETSAGDPLLLTPEAISLSANLRVLQERADEMPHSKGGVLFSADACRSERGAHPRLPLHPSDLHLSPNRSQAAHKPKRGAHITSCRS